jgi:hypothetical protein
MLAEGSSRRSGAEFNFLSKTKNRNMSKKRDARGGRDAYAKGDRVKVTGYGERVFIVISPSIGPADLVRAYPVSHPSLAYEFPKYKLKRVK